MTAHRVMVSVPMTAHRVMVSVPMTAHRVMVSVPMTAHRVMVSVPMTAHRVKQSDLPDMVSLNKHGGSVWWTSYFPWTCGIEIEHIEK
jgi:biopolymer transport protein ExbD